MLSLNKLKDTILALPQENIYSIYFDIPVSDIIWNASDNHNKTKNPLRDDSNPSLSFKYYGNKLICRDFADSFYSGDIFEVVGNILCKNCSNSYDFIYICNDILEKYENRYTNKKHNILNKNIHKSTSIKDIYVKPRRFNNCDYNYFESQGLNKKSIIDNITAVSSYYITDKSGIVKLSGYVNSVNDPCYKYIINNTFTKLYFPFRNKHSTYPRFITNNPLQIDDIQDLRYCENLILVKSIKDKLLLLQYFNRLNINSSYISILTVASETCGINDKLLNILNEHSKHKYLLFDTDDAGLSNMELLKTKGFNTLIFSLKAKDPTDFFKVFGYNETLGEVIKLIQTIKNDTT